MGVTILSVICLCWNNYTSETIEVLEVTISCVLISAFASFDIKSEPTSFHGLLFYLSVIIASIIFMQCAVIKLIRFIFVLPSLLLLLVGLLGLPNIFMEKIGFTTGCEECTNCCIKTYNCCCCNC